MVNNLIKRTHQNGKLLEKYTGGKDVDFNGGLQGARSITTGGDLGEHKPALTASTVDLWLLVFVACKNCHHFMVIIP